MSSGKTYRNRYVMRFDFVGGKIKHCKEYYNSDSVGLRVRPEDCRPVHDRNALIFDSCAS